MPKWTRGAWIVVAIACAQGPVAALGLGPVACTVDGHGPYDETKKGCESLAKRQAEVNCTLADRTAEIEAVMVTGGRRRTGKCQSRFLPDKRVCAPATCEWTAAVPCGNRCPKSI